MLQQYIRVKIFAQWKRQTIQITQLRKRIQKRLAQKVYDALCAYAGEKAGRKKVLQRRLGEKGQERLVRCWRMLRANG